MYNHRTSLLPLLTLPRNQKKRSPSENPVQVFAKRTDRENFKDVLFDALDASHVLPIRPAHTADRPRGVIYECSRPTRANDDAARTRRAASATLRRRIRVAQAVEHTLQCSVDVGAARTKVHARWQRRARHVRRESRCAGPVHGEAEGERGVRRWARVHERDELREVRVERV